MRKPLLFLCEEHHEAFLAWHHAIRNKLLAPRGNWLFHFDAHSDMSLPLLRTPLPKTPESLREVCRLTYEELRIGSYIIPSIYQEIFSEFFWIRPKPGPVRNEKRYVRTYKKEGRLFLTGHKPEPSVNRDHPAHDEVGYVHHEISLGDCVEATQPVVLDIDLDFFSCSPAAPGLRRLEISRAEFERFRTDKYHMLRLLIHCHAEQVEDRYYLIFNAGLEEISHQLESREAVETKLDGFRDFLRRCRVEPNIIDISRSRMSGYTPKDQWEFIEGRLTEILRELFNPDTVSIGEIACATD